MGWVVEVGGERMGGGWTGERRGGGFSVFFDDELTLLEIKILDLYVMWEK